MRKKKINSKEKVKSKKINYKIKLLTLLVIVAGIVIIISKNKPNSEQKENKETHLEETEYNYVLIDMNNTDNAQIVEGIKENTSPNVSKDRIVDGIEITDIKLSAENGISNFTATVKNDTGKDFVGGIATIEFINNDGKKYASIDIYIPEVRNGEINLINAATTADITNAYDFTITLQK